MKFQQLKQYCLEILDYAEKQCSDAIDYTFVRPCVFGGHCSFNGFTYVGLHKGIDDYYYVIIRDADDSVKQCFSKSLSFAIDLYNAVVSANGCWDSTDYKSLFN